MSKTVLIINDDADLLGLYQVVLRDRRPHINVIARFTSKEAVAEIQKQSVDLLITDLFRYPHDDARAYMSAFKKQRPSTPVLLVTATPVTKADADEIKCDKRLSVPFQIELLLKTIDELLDKSSAA
jgi:DNA-binding NtrC family response regulator